MSCEYSKGVYVDQDGPRGGHRDGVRGTRLDALQFASLAVGADDHQVQVDAALLETEVGPRGGKALTVGDGACHHAEAATGALLGDGD